MNLIIDAVEVFDLPFLPNFLVKHDLSSRAFEGLVKLRQFVCQAVFFSNLHFGLDYENVLEIPIPVHLHQEQSEIGEDVDFLFSFRLILPFLDFFIGVTHDSNQHIQESDLQKESRRKECDPQYNLVIAFEAFCIILSNSYLVRVYDWIEVVIRQGQTK